jgi:hypothetical protein
MLPQIKNYDELYRQFRWQIRPITISAWMSATAGRRRMPTRIAIVHVHPDGRHDDDHLSAG